MNHIQIQSVLIAALGGEGGGVLADWLVTCARNFGLSVQATSVPGVAQRTGATSYYVEWSRQAVPAGHAAPNFALSPVPARVDVVIASESLEAARMMERGFVTPDRTCLISSTSRVYTTVEKMHMEDGRFDDERIRTLAKTLARQSVLMDMDALTQQHKTVVSAVMFGALCGAGVLPWPVEICEAAIEASGKGVKASLAGFHAARNLAGATAQVEPVNTEALADAAAAFEELLSLGAARCQDYQDEKYAQAYRQRVMQAAPKSMDSALVAKAWSEAARHLALWMCYEDVIRVADLKTRPERFERVRNEAQAGADEVVHVTEHFKPGVEEVASVLPYAWGQKLLAWAVKHKKDKLHVGMHIRSTSLWGYLVLRFMANMRPMRRSSLRFKQEHTAMDAWWSALQALTPKSASMGLALAGLPQVLKGYGETQKRGHENYERIWNECVAPVLDAPLQLEQAADILNQAVKAALADPEGHLNRAAKAHPIKWFDKVPV